MLSSFIHFVGSINLSVGLASTPAPAPAPATATATAPRTCARTQTRTRLPSFTSAKVRAIHRDFDKLRLHHELSHKADLVVATNFDFSLLGAGLVPAMNNLKTEELVRSGTTVLPAAARVWAMAVQVLAHIMSASKRSLGWG